MSLLETTAPQSAESRARGFWSSVREALRGTHQDYTIGSLNRSIFLLAIPMVLEMVLESLFAVVDVFWVGRLGANAVATVGLTESMLALVMAIGMGVAMSTTAMVARRIGEKDPEDAAIAAVQAIGLGLADFAWRSAFRPASLRRNCCALMGASPEIVAGGSGYARIALGGCGAIIMLFLNNAIFRGAGDAAIAMRLLWVSNIINLILDPCLIFGLGPFPHMGVTGAALATFTGRSIGVLYQFYRLLKGTERIHVLVRHLRLNLRVMTRLLRVSMTGILQFGIAHASWIGLVRIISLFRRLGGRGLHGRHSHRDLLHPAVVGTEQCCGHAGGTEPWRQAARPRGAGGVAHGPLQHDLPRAHRRFLFRVRNAGGAAVCGRSRGGCRLPSRRCAPSAAATSATPTAW